MMQRLQRTVYVARDGVELVADRGGDPAAPAVVLLHGGGQTRHSWSRVIAPLIAAGLQVVNFDARGHGDSDWSPDGAYSLADRADDLATVTADLRVPFILVGASLGGATSIVAIDRGLAPVGLVLVDIVPEPDAKGIDRILSFMRGNPDGFASVDEAAAAVAAYNPARPRPAASGGLMKNLRAHPDGRLRWHWDPRVIEMGHERLQAVVREAADSLESRSGLAVLLVRGMSSDVVSDAGVAAFQRQFSRLELLDVAGASHMVAGDRNDAFNDGVIAFAMRVLGHGRRVIAEKTGA